jgi:hypothetical protein
MLSLADLAARPGRNPGAPEEAASWRSGSQDDAVRPNPDGGVAGTQARATSRHRLPGVLAVLGVKTNWRAMTAI